MNIIKLAWVVMIVNTADVLICIVIAVILAKKNREGETAEVPAGKLHINMPEEQINSLQEEMNAARAGYSAIKKENLELKNKLTGKETELVKAISKCSSIENDFKRNAEELRVLKTKGAKPEDFNAQIERLKKEIESQNGAISGLKKEDEGKQRRIRSLEDELRAGKDNFLASERRLQEAKRREADLNSELSKQKKLCNTIQLELDKLIKESLAVKDKLANKEVEFQDIIAKYSEIEKDFKKNTEELQVLKTKSVKLEGFNAQIEKLKKEREVNSNAVTKLRKEGEEKEKRIYLLQDEFKRVSEKLKLFKTKNVKSSDFNAQKDSDNTKQISVLQEELKAAQDSYSVARSELQEVSKKALDFSKELAKQKGMLDANKAELEQLRKENPELKENLAGKKNELQNIFSDYSALEKDFEKVSEEVEVLKIENAELSCFRAAVEEAKDKIEEPDNLNPELKKEEEKSSEVSEEQEKKLLADLELKSRQKYMQIGEIMLQQNSVTKEALAETFEYQEEYGGSIAMYLINHAHIDELKLAQTICHQFGVPYLPLSSYDIPGEIIKLVPMDIAEKYWLIPLQKSGVSLSVAMVDPFDFNAIEAVEKKTGYKVQAFIGVLSDIIQAMENYYKIVVKGTDYKGQKSTPLFITTEVYKGFERRREPRFEIKLDVFFPYQGSYKKSVTKNVSRGGFLLNSDVPLEIGSNIPLQIDLPKAVSLWPILAVIQVLRIQPSENGNFDVAVKTIKIAQEEIDMIIKFALDHKEK